MTLPRPTTLTVAFIARFCAPSIAHAQSTDAVVVAPAPARPGTTVRSDPGPRVRFGIGPAAGLVYGTATSGAGVLGAQLDLGIQINDRIAIYARGVATSLLVLQCANAALMFEYTPAPGLSLAVGPMVDGYAQTLRFPEDSPSERDLGASFLVAYNLTHRLHDGRRQGFRVSWEVVAGADPDAPLGAGVGVGTMIGMGFVTM